MDKFQEIQEKNLERGNLILKAFGQNDEIIEKGGKLAVLGEVREFKGKKYRKIVGGWRPMEKLIKCF